MLEATKSTLDDINQYGQFWNETVDESMILSNNSVDADANMQNKENEQHQNVM